MGTHPPNSLMVRGYERGREDHEVDPKLANFFLVGKRSEDKQQIHKIPFENICVYGI